MPDETPEAALPLTEAILNNLCGRASLYGLPSGNHEQEKVLAANIARLVSYESVLDALRAARGAELDVERLARALMVVTRGFWSTPTRRSPDAQKRQDDKWLRDTADAIAREYAALGDDHA